MAQFVVLQLLRNFRELRTLEKQCSEKEWRRLDVRDASRVTVGIMGLGSIGTVVASAIVGLGFKVVGWSRTGRDRPDMSVFAGERGLNDFLAASNFLVCLLPATNQTIGLLDRSRLEKLPKGAFLINAARGGILVENDFLDLLNENRLSGAVLDVFDTEPLPRTSPFWDCDNVLVTPHIAAQPTINVVVDQFINNLGRLENGLPILHEINRKIGY
ncbi:NAD(P)-dependent oxidoreductase [Xanthomonas citri]|uniref:NAD(P)-dependent oxidoreductase n=1 Tax=Xanthomonas citri TaxID=346 RepID=UPI001900A124|nr:NAD(P)-dependent oxidoreductase [Xanthomonas citri]